MFARMSEHRTLLARLRSEPLVAFLASGLALFAIDRARSPGEADEARARRIVIDAPFVEGLRAELTRRTGHAPNERELATAVDGWVREEALFREARALGLDVGDLIVRRRLVQKMELVLAGEAVPDEPTEDELEAWLTAHATDFRAPARTSVTLCFFSRELHEDPVADATRALAFSDPPRCDPQIAGSALHARADAQLRASLGDVLADAIAAAPLAAWSGPTETTRGVYLVRVDERREAHDRALAEVHDEVRDAVVEDARARAIRAAETALVGRYEVVRP